MKYIMIIAMVLFSTNVMASEKTKAEWQELYAAAGCNEMSFVNRKICETKVFQKTNWQSGKDQLNNTFKKLGVN